MNPFARDLLAWFKRSQRDLPWRSRRSPYATWVSEVMLQQTTVDVVAPRFDEFLARFPDVASLARATEEEVVDLWAGLGYYRRARSLHAGARAVALTFGGTIPRTVAELLTLPGVGSYTAGAIAAIAFGERAVGLDGNVLRVASRVFAESGDVRSLSVRRGLEARLLERSPAGAHGPFAEALIELGALVCRPVAPECPRCPLRRRCAAQSAGTPEAFPKARAARKSIPVLSSRAFVRRAGTVLLVERPSSASLLPGFFELPGRWGPVDEDPATAVNEVMTSLGFRNFTVGEILAEARHAITHHRIRAVLVKVRATSAPARLEGVFADLRVFDLRKLTTESRKLLARDAIA